MATHPVKACLITNPRSGRGGVDLSEALPILYAHGWDAVVRQKLYGGHATELARQAARDGYDVVVNCGGDGTLSEIVDGLAGTDMCVGELPGGTENVWARECGIARQLRVAALQLVGAERRRVDVGHVSIDGHHGQHFLLMAGLGLDGAVMARVSKPLKNRIGPLAVGLAALEALPTFSAVPVRVALDGVHWQGRVSQIVVGNTRQYGGFTRVTPGAYIDDGLLDVCLITATGPVGGGRQLASLFVRRQPLAASAESYRAARITITAPVVLPLQLDGGAVRHKNLAPAPDGIVYTFSALPQGLSVLVPRAYDGDLFQRGPLSGPGVHLLPPPAHMDGADDQEQRKRGHDASRAHDEKGTGNRMRVMAVGVDTITALRLRNGRVMTVRLGPRTMLEDGAGTTRDTRAFLATLADGDILRVKGKKVGDGAIRARHITVLTRHEG